MRQHPKQRRFLKTGTQQDGATCHTARATIDLLKDTFGDRLISRFGPVNWPPRSFDLTPLYYFLWGYVKSLVYEDKPQTRDHLEDNIRSVIADIRPQMLEKVIEIGRPDWTTSEPAVAVICQKSYLKFTAKRNRRSTASDLSRQLSSATGTTVSRQTVYRRLGHIGLYARRPVRCVPLTTTHCRLRLTWSREHALWTPQQWSCVKFSPPSPGLVCGLILAGL
ncbi:transposable element Tcb1 transposase [Trichonephila clavipes]|nr:transposable element Tcb1 transposase [Trichonephila clavipes]